MRVLWPSRSTISGANWLVFNMVDVDVFAAQRNRGGVDVVKSLSECDSPASTRVIVITTLAIPVVAFRSETVRLIEQPGLGKANRGVGLLGSRLQRNSK